MESFFCYSCRPKSNTKISANPTDFKRPKGHITLDFGNSLVYGCFKSKSSYACIYTDWFLQSIYNIYFLCPIIFVCACTVCVMVSSQSAFQLYIFGGKDLWFLLVKPRCSKESSLYVCFFHEPTVFGKRLMEKRAKYKDWHRLILWDTSVHACHWLTRFGLLAVMERARFWMSDIALLLLSCTSRKKCFTCEIISFGKKQAVLWITWEVMGYKLSRKHCFLFSLNLPWLYIYGSYWVFSGKNCWTWSYKIWTISWDLIPINKTSQIFRPHTLSSSLSPDSRE